MKKYNIDPNIKESILSNEYYNMRSSRDFYKGTSFKMSLWELNSHYFNDENIVDFVSYKGCLLTCTRNHVSSIYNEPKVVIENNIITGIEDNIFWSFVIGTNGKGEKGDPFTYNDFTEEQLLSLVGPKGEKGNDGKDGLPGINGKDGVNGTDGINGLNGRDGANGKDGVGVIPGGITGQALMKKSNNDYDTVWSDVEPPVMPKFIAEVENVTSTTTANVNVILENNTFKFSFGIPKGKDGINGNDGNDGAPGLPGSDGRTSYFHIKYSSIPNPTLAVHMTETPNLYIGTYVDFIQLDSTNPIDYTWSRFEGLQGSKGEQGIPGINGEDGTTSYLHIKYSNDGGKTFTGNNGEDPGSWLGIYVDDILNDSSDPSVYKWTKIQGEQGLPGAAGAPGVAGKDGVDGLPGIGIEVRYCLGTETSFTGINNPGIMREPTGWTLSIPTKTTVNPYIWFIQSRINYTDNTDKVGTIEGSWTKPERLSGLNGLNGANGSKAPIIYPEGVYSISTIYTSTIDKAPYVFDSVDNNYYILNIVGSWQGSTFPVEVQLPSTDTSGSWLKLDAYEAIYSKIGIFGNALIGAAVFNGDFVFSQHGIDKDGNPSTRYEEFLPAAPTGGVFTPNILFNFKTGAGHLSAGKIKFDDTGSVKAVDLQLTGNSGITPNTISVDSDGFGTLTDLNSFVPSYDGTIHLDFALGKGKNNAFAVGNIYNGKLINNSGWIAEVTTVGSTFVSVLHTGTDEPDGRYISSKRLDLRTSSVLEYMWVPSNYNANGIWEGDLIIMNKESFGYIGSFINMDGYFSSKGMGQTVINSNIMIKGVVTLDSELGLYLRYTSQSEFFRIAITSITDTHWQLSYTDYTLTDQPSLEDIMFMIAPIKIENTFITFSCMHNIRPEFKPVIDIFISSQIPYGSNSSTYFIAWLK